MHVKGVLLSHPRQTVPAFGTTSLGHLLAARQMALPCLCVLQFVIALGTVYYVYIHCISARVIGF